ncbi:MAG: cobalamin-dependent protein [Magnetococcales bacterium]|nr:cobalamin-dependent protein [Magnetococcales bacterium]
MNKINTKILIVNPPPFQLVETFDTPEYPRLTLACLAAYLRERDWQVDVLDCKYDQLNMMEAMNKIKSMSPTVIGVTAMTNEIKQAGELARLVKEHDLDIVTLIGGVHLTFAHEQTLREFPAFDYGIVGEGEETLDALLCELQTDTPITSPGVCWIDHEKQYHFTGMRALINDINILPMPAWDMFRPATFYSIQTSRGCPFSCNFCTNQWGRMIRPRSPEKTIAELIWLADRMAPKMISFADEVFSINRNRTIEIMRMLIENNLGKRFAWRCQTHINAIDFELATLMRSAGCIMVALGVESGNEITLKNIGKGITKKRILETGAALKKAKLPFTSFFIIGQPNETPESANETIRFAIELNADVPVIGIMVPYPGTKIWEMMERGEGGYIRQTLDWNEFNKQIGNAVTFQGISRKKLESIQLFGYIKVFLYNLRFFDLAKFAFKYRRLVLSMIKKVILPSNL